jgi:uncharacterized membrane protein
MARFALGTLIILCGAIASERSEAANWRICNKTAEPMWVAIAYDPGNGRHVSRGWWRLNACGGCATIGNYNVLGVWYHAHNRDRSRRVEGDDLFCTSSPMAFNLDNQAACRVPTNRSLAFLGFRSVVLRGSTFTSSITGRAANGSMCID